MAILKVVQTPAEVLTKKCDKVKGYDAEVIQIITDLEDTLWDVRQKAIGLAAPQIGYTKRIFVAHRILKKDDDPIRYVFVNPEITKFSGAQEIGWEACLSIPDTFCRVKRSKEVVVEYLDKNGDKQKTRASGFFARVLQHEIDHLDGVLITDRCIGESKNEKELDALLNSESVQND